MKSACTQRAVLRRDSVTARAPMCRNATRAPATTSHSTNGTVHLTPEFAARVTAELIDLANIDTCVRGRATRLVWRMDTLRKRGDVTERQYAAAADLMALLEAGNDRTQHVMSRLDERVDQSRRPIVARTTDGEARTRLRNAMGAVGRVERALINTVVFDNGDVVTVVDSGALQRLGTGDQKALRKSAMDILKNALDNIADHLEAHPARIADNR